MNKKEQYEEIVSILGGRHKTPEWVAMKIIEGEDRNALAEAMEFFHMGYEKSSGSVFRYPKELAAIVERDKYCSFHCVALAKFEQMKEAFLRTWDGWKE